MRYIGRVADFCGASTRLFLKLLNSEGPGAGGPSYREAKGGALSGGAPGLALFETWASAPCQSWGSA